MSLKVNERNEFLKMFEFDKNLIKCKTNGWYQLLMKDELNLDKKQYFEMRLVKSRNKYIMIGIVGL